MTSILQKIIFDAALTALVSGKDGLVPYISDHPSSTVLHQNLKAYWSKFRSKVLDWSLVITISQRHIGCGSVYPYKSAYSFLLNGSMFGISRSSTTT
ncbi:uncharacterized protein RAG0_05747 [Rhynchosporium agropyri]|uniref:Uncharacterized protein n=1 Tax=Rhynchosporium agropyri TaxID=914238 RepID=A0A1E1KEG3_9HELO|nr:uncharacterized protein RAG0_05747 [Rhynchosporium agropyri]